MKYTCKHYSSSNQYYLGRKRRMKDLFQKNSSKQLCPAFQETNSVFIHIPKTGGVSIISGLYGIKDFGHRTMAYYQGYYGRKLRGMFTFCIVRNPWDRVVSAYEFLKRGGLNQTDAEFGEDVIQRYTDFDSFVMNWLNENSLRSFVHFIPQTDFLHGLSSNQLRVAFVGRFEKLNDSYSHVAKLLKLPEHTLPEKNVRTNKIHYSEYYNEETKSHIANLYAQDIKNFGYSFNLNTGSW